MHLFLRLRLIWAILAALAVAPVQARDLRREFVWDMLKEQVPGTEPKTGLVLRDPAKRGGTYENVMLTCGEPGVTFSLSPVDRKSLGQAFLREASLDVTLITDGQAHAFGKPRIAFNEMDEFWEYEIVAQSVDVLRAMARAGSIRAFGEGLDQQLPVDRATLSAFADACDRHVGQSARSSTRRQKAEAAPRTPPEAAPVADALNHSSEFKPVRTLKVVPPGSAAEARPTSIAEDQKAIADLERQIARLGAQAKTLRGREPMQAGELGTLQKTAQPAPAPATALSAPDLNAVVRQVKALADARSGLLSQDKDFRACGDDRGCQLLVLAGQQDRLAGEAQQTLVAEMRYRATGTIKPGSERLGDCHATTIRRLGDGFDGPLRAPDADGLTQGVSVAFANRLFQTGRDDVPALRRARTGDAVSVCLVRLPRGCPRGDDRGKVYLTLDHRTGETWRLANAHHLCGGA